MQDLQEIFIRMEENKKKLKDIRSAYKDALKNVQEYVQVDDEMKTLRERKKSIETVVKEQFSSEFTKMEDIAIDIQSDQEMMNDIALTQVMKGETVAVKGQNEEEYEPIFNVKFKKVQ